MNDLRAPSFIARSEMSMFPPEPTYVSIKARPFLFLPMMPCLLLLHSVNGDKPLYLAFFYAT